MAGHNHREYALIRRLGELDVAAPLTDFNKARPCEFADDLSVRQRPIWRQPLPQCDESGAQRWEREIRNEARAPPADSQEPLQRSLLDWPHRHQGPALHTTPLPDTRLRQTLVSSLIAPTLGDYIRQSYHGRPNKAGGLYEHSLKLQGFLDFAPVPQSGLIF